MSGRLRAIIAIIVGIAGLSYLIFAVGFGGSKEETTVPSSSNNSVVRPTNTQTAQGGKYVDYSSEALASATGTRLLFFHAPWCPQCRELDDSIKTGSIPDNVTIFKVDYDSNQKLRQQYGVTIQTTVVRIDNDGKETKKYVLYDQPSLKTITENLL